jgi:protoheme IX farnesyltransferase
VSTALVIDVQTHPPVARRRMKTAPVDGSVPVAVPDTRRHAYGDFLALTKPRVNLLVLFTTLIGFHLGTFGPTDIVLLIHTVIGTALVAGAAAAINQVLERDSDRLMRRTRLRPLAAGRLGKREAGWFALVLAVIGLAQLALGANLLAALVALATIASYSLVYTPLKRRTSLATVIGAVPGALPPMIGWAAATGGLSVEAWVLFAIVFVWQMPHVLAISWMYREDYERGGIRVLPVEEPDGASTSRQTVSYAAVLVPISLLPTVVGLAGGAYLGGALLLSLVILGLSIAFARQRTARHARRLFFASLLYLPVLWVLMLVNRT